MDLKTLKKYVNVPGLLSDYPTLNAALGREQPKCPCCGRDMQIIIGPMNNKGGYAVHYQCVVDTRESGNCGVWQTTPVASESIDDAVRRAYKEATSRIERGQWL